MLSAEDREAHKRHFDAFGKHPTWNKLKNDPQYADTVSKNYELVPRTNGVLADLRAHEVRSSGFWRQLHTSDHPGDGSYSMRKKLVLP